MPSEASPEAIEAPLERGPAAARFPDEVRDAPDLEVFMAVRHHQIDFASGALVFPGGKATDDDRRPEWRDRIDGDLGALTVAAIAAAISAPRSASSSITHRTCWMPSGATKS